MSERQPPIRLLPTAGLKQDLQTLHDAAVMHPHGPEDRLLRVALNQLGRIQQGAPSTHPLEYMPSYPDLSDCETTYVGADPHAKPSHRIVWRERAPRRPGDSITCEIIALGERANGQAYYMAGQRLGRPVGFTLAELAAQREPIARDSRSRQRSIRNFHAPSSGEPDLQFD
ncbi:hypothetical protein OIU91_03940 [Streptomyces sp. NBC_01456]|uniref:hypothetical protein n=1 Tax=unclassified Streptomyces TaxID=2593676 RepID=UPI002E335276|nr:MULTISPECIES: hypothetical protein [unclassified Streptomyces]